MKSENSKELYLVNLLLEKLFPIFRSITGKGINETIHILKEYINLKVLRFKSGDKVDDWTVPLEWNIRKAFIITPDNKRICDIKNNNLHIINYSTPINKVVSRKELDKNLHSITELPNAIPYITSYYKKRWGFCISDDQRKSLKNGKYRVLIESYFKKGNLPVAESLIKGKSRKEVVFTSYICHPSMANDQLSGPITLTLLYKRLMKKKNKKFSYRFIFMPETIGSICYLSRKFETLKKNIIAGYVVSLTGGKGPFTYRKSRSGNTITDSLVIRNLKKRKHIIEEFNPASGNDQRQFCSPGYNLNFGCITYTKNKKTKEYHNSLDDLSFVSSANIIRSVNLCENIVDSFEDLKIYKRLKMKGEPFLSKYALYSTLGQSSSFNSSNKFTKSLMWLLNLSDGQHDLSMIAEKSKIDIEYLNYVTKICLKKNLIREM